MPRYRGLKWIGTDLPRGCQLWLPGKRYTVSKDLSHHRALTREFLDLLDRNRWKWPGRTTYFFSDLHGDAQAFLSSLVASGGVKKTGPQDRDLKLTKSGRHAQFIIGGDCFDKGPSSLQLLRVIRVLMRRGARVRILAGNHDVRLMLGIHSLFLERDIRTAHFFIRMGPKVIPLLKEINEGYLQSSKALRGIPDERECRRRIYPPKSWFSEFPSVARWVMPDDGIEREMKRLRVKMDRFEEECRKAGLSMRMVYAAAKKWRQLFLKERGEFAWFFDKAKLAHCEGSFLFIHAGLDDRIARIIRNKGIRHLNRMFNRQLYNDPFDFYYGPLANTVRTKYRDSDMPLTRRGVQLVHEKGIHAIVHGHQIKLHGQRIMLRKGIINFECDATLDRNTRKREKLKGQGAAVTIFRPEGMVMGISTDFPFIKLFEPKVLRRELKEILTRPSRRNKR